MRADEIARPPEKQTNRDKSHLRAYKRTTYPSILEASHLLLTLVRYFGVSVPIAYPKLYLSGLASIYNDASSVPSGRSTKVLVSTAKSPVLVLVKIAVLFVLGLIVSPISSWKNIER
jgi:hypothetical protein